MMFRKIRFRVPGMLLMTFLIISGCTKKWEDHTAIVDPALKEDLVTAIKNAPDLTRFSELLVKSGYDKIIASSKTFTVWAPTDQALQQLDASIVNDTARLKLFLGNHISNQSYLIGALPEQRIKMLNGKYISLSGNKFDSASVTTANKYANNGILHIIDKFIPRLDNCWEFVNNTALVPLMKNFLLSLNYQKFDSTQAVQTGVDPNTGLPIYKPGTGYQPRNVFLDSIMNVSDEAGLYTLVLLNDNSYSSEFNKLKPWFVTETADSTNRLTGKWLVKDLAFKGLYTIAQLPDTVISQYGVKVPLNKSAIVSSVRTSNGIVYIMNQVNFSLAYKFPPIIIEGENPSEFSADRATFTFYRIRKNPNTGVIFKDILIQNYGAASFAVQYSVNNMSSMRYNAYWVAVNDIVPPPAPPALPSPWAQRFAVDSVPLTTRFPYVPVQYNNYNEVPLGQFTIDKFRNVNFYVVGPVASSTINNVDVISLDYIKLVPAF